MVTDTMILHFSLILKVFILIQKEQKTKKLSFPHLELSDLISYHIHNFVKNNKKSSEYLLIEPKLYNYPNFTGYGMKLFP